MRVQGVRGALAALDEELRRLVVLVRHRRGGWLGSAPRTSTTTQQPTRRLHHRRVRQSSALHRPVRDIHTPLTRIWPVAEFPPAQSIYSTSRLFYSAHTTLPGPPLLSPSKFYHFRPFSLKIQEKQVECWPAVSCQRETWGHKMAAAGKLSRVPAAARRGRCL